MKSKRGETPRRGEIPSGRTIGQAVSDAFARGTQIRVARLESELVELRKSARVVPAARRRRHRAPDPRKVFIATMKARGMDGRQICRALDATSRKELEPLASWIAATGLRLWLELWNSQDRMIRNRVRTYIHTVAPFDPKTSH